MHGITSVLTIVDTLSHSSAFIYPSSLIRGYLDIFGVRSSGGYYVPLFTAVLRYCMSLLVCV